MTGEPLVLPDWPVQTVAVLSTVDAGGPHAIPVSAPVRAADRMIMINLRHSRDSLSRLREQPRVALTVLAAGDVAFTARGRARAVPGPLAASPDYWGITIEVDAIDDHRQEAFAVTAGVGREWRDEGARAALGKRVGALRAFAERAG